MPTSAGVLDDPVEVARRARALLAAAERETNEDLEQARRDVGRCRELQEALALQMVSGSYIQAAATASMLSAWARAVSVRLETATARSIGLRAGRAAALLEMQERNAP